MLRSTSFVLCFGLTLLGTALPLSPEASAQVFNSGPSNPALFSTVINLPPDPNLGDFESIAEGTQLNVADGGSVGIEFQASSGSEVNISGGSVGVDFLANSGTEVNISGGSVEGNFRVLSGSEVSVSGGTLDSFSASSSSVNISGGTITGFLLASSNSVVNLSGGTVGRMFIASGSILNISEGTVNFLNPGSGVVNISGGNVLSVAAGITSTINISGGTVADLRSFTNGTNVNFFGTEFSLDGTPLMSLIPSQAFVISLSETSGLTGTLNDGTAFAFNEVSPFFLRPDSTVTVTLTTPFLLGDVTGDGLVSFLDISPFIALLSSGEFQDEADIDRNGVVNFLDIGPFIAVLSGQ